MLSFGFSFVKLIVEGDIFCAATGTHGSCLENNSTQNPVQRKSDSRLHFEVLYIRLFVE